MGTTVDMKETYCLEHRGMSPGVTIEFEDIEEAQQCMILLLKGTKVAGYPVGQVNMKFKYIEEGQEDEEMVHG